MFARKHYRSNADAAKFLSADISEGETITTANGKYEMSAPGHKLWRWENSRGDNVAITGHNLAGARFGTYAVSLNGHITATTGARTEAERIAAELRSEVSDGRLFDGEGKIVNRNGLMSVCKHYTEENVAQMSNGELGDLYQTTDKTEYPPYELPENDEN